MRIFSLVSLFTLGLFYAGLAQVDVLNARANPKTFIFDDDKHTVHGYIYSQLKEKTSCCGNDAVYLEVKFDASGSVTSAKTLTGKNECFKQSVVDIVSSVRWDATGVQGSKTIYFEVKPIIPCSGSPNENVYKKIPRVGGDAPIASSGNEGSNEVAVKDTPKETVEPVKEEVVVAPVKEIPKETVKPVVEEVVEVETKTPTKAVEEDGFLSDESGMEESSSSEDVKPAKETVKPVVKQPTKEVIADVQPTKEKVTLNERASSPAPTPVAKPRSGGSGNIPPQAKLDSVSNGDVSPDPSHRETHANLQPGRVEDVKISDESQFGVQMRTSLRKAGYCGLANALIEVEVDRYGSVVNSRIMYANSDKVKEILPGIVKGLKFQAPGAGNVKSFYSYYQVKTEIVCDGGKPKYNLDEVPPVIKTPEGQP